ncbi:MAG: hypothetical protein VX346_19435 [Planctomycetota bacterium]|nr:hypothetical protein [Planctomycetota bacterium]
MTKRPHDESPASPQEVPTGDQAQADSAAPKPDATIDLNPGDGGQNSGGQGSEKIVEATFVQTPQNRQETSSDVKLPDAKTAGVREF